ncbi:iron-sulfur cluster carrier protein [Blastomonas marina]|uniref:Iron-sulfur cluster carrier protein n=1 Tax=Blastomonas marina TaxID=1867408 RepID=A0ABQ1F569_9SPHN|nr:iron-sulfur cluster carrier protein [Blastomonas marina]
MERLPDDLRARVQSARLAEGRAVLVLDASGLDAAARKALEDETRSRVGALDDVSEVHVALTADKPHRRMIAIGSGKGGVGKSTLAANLAVALARRGRKVGVVDADIYGPSQARLLSTEGQKPTARDKQLIPLDTESGVRLLSMGNLVEADRAIAWRGPMVAGALGQMIEGDWGDTDTLIVDLPPGTGDVQLTMVQKHKPDGAIIVSTPQDLALMDATRALNLFHTADVPIVGLVENMAGYVCPHCGEVSDPFGSGGMESVAEQINVPFLGRIPLDIAIRTASDAGKPVAGGDDLRGRAFDAIAERLEAWMAS